MGKDVRVHHVAVECASELHADCFFTTILRIPKVKNTMLSKELSAAIFKIDKSVSFNTYDDGKTRFEVFINPDRNEQIYVHTCIEVDNKNDFISRCKDQGLDPFFINKDGKELLFVRDLSGNLYEIK
jgi:hypothetical protein